MKIHKLHVIVFAILASTVFTNAVKGVEKTSYVFFEAAPMLVTIKDKLEGVNYNSTLYGGSIIFGYQFTRWFNFRAEMAVLYGKSQIEGSPYGYNVTATVRHSMVASILSPAFVIPLDEGIKGGELALELSPVIASYSATHKADYGVNAQSNDTVYGGQVSIRVPTSENGFMRLTFSSLKKGDIFRVSISGGTKL